ncbi:hypothetical protein THRCLA_05691 [Thraustotheca clavata]|uniref:Uncharacterized protein n=1 Tax=Thraustotheca clavata TaxID=74557 RepID=A0A1V9ZVM8_9STRA|nr:hypothetical protein THRCLA_05691 [Thraustotheca clavata]
MATFVSRPSYRSHTVHSSTTTALTTQGSNVKPVLIFAWNDFLCPTTYLSQRKWNNHLQKSEKASFAKLDNEIERILIEASRMGLVFVLCESNAATIESLCHKFLPRTTSLFSSKQHQSKIHLICAATAITPKWHAQIIHSICTRNPYLVNSNIMMIVCGRDVHRSSLLEVAKYVPMLPKVVKSSQLQPTITQAATMLKSITECLSVAVNHTESLDLSI